MKNNFNLNQLAMSWNEKQKPRRIGQYAAILFMLLTLGVGQMWGAGQCSYHWKGKVYFRAPNSWDLSTYKYTRLGVARTTDTNTNTYQDFFGQMTQISNTRLFYLSIDADHSGWGQCEYIFFTTNEHKDYGSGTFKVNNSHYYTVPKDYGCNNSSNYYLFNPSSDTGGPAVDASWDDTRNDLFKLSNTIAVKVKKAGSGSYTTPSSTTEMPATSVGVTAYYLNGDNSSTSNTVSCSGSTYSASFYGCPGGKITLSQTAKDGYTFDGFYVSSSSVTSPYYPTSGSAITIEARYTENTYTVSFDNDGHGSTTPSSDQTVGEITGVAISASNNTGYHFDTWTISDGDGSFASAATTASNTFYPTEDATITASFAANTYNITLKGNGGSDGSVTTTYNSSSTTSFSEASRASYSCDGYYTAKTDGTLVLNADGTIPSSTVSNYLSSGKWIGDTVTVLWAHWTYNPTLYDVTFGVGTSYTSLGSISATNNSTSSAISSGDDLAAGTSVTFTATPETGYEVAGFYSDASCTSSLQSGNTTTYTIASLSADVTVYVKFIEKTWTVTFANDGHGTTSPSSNQTVGQLTGVSISATPSTGYTFNTWTITSGSGSFTSSASTNSNTFKPTAASTITASFNETMSSLSTSCHYDAGNPSYSAPTVSNSATTVGYTTTRTITAASASTGYTFAGWTLTNCVRTDGGGATANPITIRSNGDGEDVSVVANYTEVLTTNWKLIGDNQTGGPFGDDYTYSSGKAMSKKTGHSTESNAYVTVNVTKIPADNYGFKVATSNSNSDKWGYGESDGYYIDFNRSASDSKKQVYSGNQHQLRFYPDALGEYEFRVNYPSNKYVYVTFPTAYAVTFGEGTGGNSVTAKYNNVSFSSGTKVQNGKTVTFTQTANTGYHFVKWYTNNTGTSGTQLSTSATYDHTVGATNNVYAIYEPNTYTITLHTEDATTDGTTSVTATYKANTNLTTRITKPTRTGYTFDGYYTGTAGSGTQLIDANGDFIASVTNYTNASRQWQKASDVDLYAKWIQTVTLDGNGAGSSDGSVGVVYKKVGAVTSSFSAASRTGYTCNGYYTATSTGYQVFTSAGVMNTYTSNIASWVNSSNQWCHSGATTLYAQWTANTYDVILNVNGATTGSNQTVTATFDAAMPTTQKGGSTPISAPSRTGYTFGGYWTNTNGTGTQYYTAGLASNHVWDVATNNTNIYAKWTAKSYTVTLDVDEDDQGTIAGATTSQTVYYDGVTTTVPNRPTAANGYALVGYYTDQAGEGIKLINGDGTWIASVDGYTDGSKNWVHDGDVTLYAFYKKAEITNLVLSPNAVPNDGTTITATPTISPSPTGDTKICWELQYSNGTAHASQPVFTSIGGNAVTFPAPTASATYRVECKLYTGTTCGSGTLLDSRYTTFQVAGEHTVTIRYQDADGRTLAASSSMTAQPLDWSDAITAPSIVGYKFHHWVLGDGITINTGASQSAGDKDTEGTATINIKASYAGTLTAVYTKKRVIYFNNTLGWSKVYVYFYKNDSYWENTGDKRGSGANGTFPFTDTPFSENYWGEMTQIEGTNIYYFDAEEKGVNASYDDVVFTEANQFGYDYFNKTKAVRRGDYNSTKLPMFVPLADQTPDTHNETKYYNHGYWMNYPENTGYSLLIYNQQTKAGATKLYEIPFEFTADFTMPMEVTVDLEAGQTYGFEIKRADGEYYSNTGKMTANTTNWSMTKNQSSYCGLQTTAAGDYTFNLFYSSSNYRVGVTYPVAVNDYRIVYTDLATWSKTAHTASWYHPSRVITKNSSATEVKKDTVSFFWTYGSSPAIAYQRCSAVSAGSASWSASTSVSVSGYSSVLNKKGIYNFIFEQPAGGASISLVKVEPYTGNFYIRTDCAGSTKWSNFQSLDHQMTYSDYAETNSGYSHYYCHWTTTGQNVKFCIANDYSQCITDTLVEDIETVIADITTEGNANAGRLNSANANIRFMWDQSTNKISRAYIGGSGTITDLFLVLEGDAKMYDENGNALTGDHQDHDKYGNYLGTDDHVIMHDDENFVYERTIKVNASAKAKLTAKYNGSYQFFKGGSGTTSADSVQLLGGTYNAEKKYSMRIVYDFKTNRLVTAYLPEGEVDDPIAIHADLMLVREHQEDGQQLTFTGDGALSEVQTVYGVMRFNRWTLNNKSTAAGHAPLGDPKSPYERGLYWISFPFDVNLSDVFGFGTYGVDWIVMEYDGAERAQKGYWKDSDGFWKYITNRSGKTLEAGKGYVLALDLDRMKSDDDEFWTNHIEQVELFFPSAANVGGIEATNVTTTVDSHECTIDRTGNNGSDINKNRTKADSHWNLIGVPSYANYGTTLTSDGSTTITWNTTPSATNSLPFLYEWNMVDNTYTVQSGSTYPFKSLHAYMVQYQGNIYWSLASATPESSIVARRTYAEQPQSAEFRLELQQNDKMVDQTFVKLSNDENASANFIFDEDLCKEYNGTKANIYTFIEGYIPAAGNTLPMSEQTTLVPVGVKTVASGDYTFAIPDGTNGVGVTLIDNVANTRTNLGLMDYTVNLTAGTIDGRFVLEISPIAQNPTDIEAVSEQDSAVRKVMIDGILYIVKGNRIYDATGALVK